MKADLIAAGPVAGVRKGTVSVQTDATAETGGSAGGEMAFSGGFSVYMNNIRTSSVRCDADHRLMGSWPKDLRHPLMSAYGY